MTGPDITDESARGRDALRELGVEPAPADVLARLEARLEGELGRPAPVRRRRPRLAFAIPGFAVALASAVVVVVLINGSRPQQESAFSVRAKSAAPLAPNATAGGAAADSSASAQKAIARVRVPSLVGHGLAYVRSVTAARGLKWQFFAGTTCPPVPSVRVKRQLPPQGALVAPGTTIRISIGTCVRYDSGS